MKRAVLFTIAMIVFAFALLHQGRGLAQRRGAQIPPAGTAQRAEITPDKVVSTQQRINRYFNNDVAPKLKPCWKTLRGNGTIQFEYTFTKPRNGSRWTLNKIVTDQTTLPQAQEVIALRCMQTAVGGTSFAATSDDTLQTSYTLYWSWPVPFPANADELTTAMLRMRATNGGSTSSDDCDGHGTKAKCQTCSNGVCKTVCVGTKKCTIEGAGGPLGCTGSGGYCASGGPFGVSGGSRVMF